MSEQFEQTFRSILEEMTVEPPTDMWERINTRLVAGKRRKRRLLTVSGVAAAVALLLVSVIFLRQQQPTLHKQQLAAAITPSVQLPVIYSEGLSVPPELPPVRKYTSSPALTSQMQLPDPVILLPSIANSIENSDNIHPEMLAVHVPENFIPLTSSEALINLEKYRALIGEKDIPLRIPERTPQDNTVHIASAKPAKENKASRSYRIGGYLSPGYSSGNVNNEQNQALMAATEDNMSGTFALNGGLTFAVNTGKRLSIETGVGFSRFGQKTSNAHVYTLATSNTSEAFAEQAQVVTALGTLKSPAAAMVTLKEQSGDVLHEVRNSQSGTIEQQFGTIEIPVLLRYYINDDRLKFSLLGGFGANIFVDNKSYLSYSGKREQMGKTEDIRDFNISTHIGFGIEYPLTKALYFRLEPGFKYYLQSISRNSSIDFKPYSFNISTGFGINF